EDGIRDRNVTGVQTCALPICREYIIRWVITLAIPKYQQIKNDLLKKIQSGEFESGDRFYSESELVKMYNVSSITVIRAIQDLAKIGRASCRERWYSEVGCEL